MKQTKTFTFKIIAANQVKLDMLNDYTSEVNEIVSDMLKRKYTTAVEERKIKGIWHKPYSNYSVGTAIIQQTERFVDAKLKGYFTWCKKRKRKVKYPQIKNAPIILRNDNFRVEYSEKTSKFDYWLTFRRTSFPVHVHEHAATQLKNSNRFIGSQIVKKGKSFFLKLSVEFIIEDKPVQKSLGVDMGILRPIYCSDGFTIGNGRYIVHKKLEFQKKRSEQQSKAKDITHKQNNWNKDYAHKLSKQLVDYALENNYTDIVLEKLKGHHLSNRKGRKFSWAFAQLQNYITYKANSVGITVTYVKPHGTSITCNKCLTKDKRFRRSQGLFKCDCGYTTNADLNASINIQRLSPLNGLLCESSQDETCRGMQACSCNKHVDEFVKSEDTIL